MACAPAYFDKIDPIADNSNNSAPRVIGPLCPNLTYFFEIAEEAEMETKR